MSVTNDAEYLQERATNLAEYEKERDLAISRKERNEYQEGELERVRDAQRLDYAMAMARAYAAFQEREEREARIRAAGSVVVPRSAPGGE